MTTLFVRRATRKRGPMLTWRRPPGLRASVTCSLGPKRGPMLTQIAAVFRGAGLPACAQASRAPADPSEAPC
jgi:hypothetical protein